MSTVAQNHDNVVEIKKSIRPHPCQAFAVVGIDGVDCQNNAQYVVDGDIALCETHTQEVASSEQ